MRKRIVAVLLCSLILGGLLAAKFVFSGRDDFRRELLVSEVQEKQRVISHERLAGMPDSLLYLLASYGEEAFLAGEYFHPQNPDIVVTLYTMFGEMDRFRKMIEKYGYADTLPIVWDFFQNDHLSYEIKAGIARLLRRGEKETPDPAENPEQEALRQKVSRALYVIERIMTDGHDFLRQWAIRPDTSVERIRTKQFFFHAENFSLGGIVEIEKKHRLRERISRGDYVRAAIDVAALGFISAHALRLVHGGTVAVTAAKGSRIRRTVSLARKVAPVTAGKVLKYGTIIGIPVVAITHPYLFTAAVGWVGKQMGLPTGTAETIAWIAVTMLWLFILSIVLRILSFFMPVIQMIRRKI